MHTILSDCTVPKCPITSLFCALQKLLTGFKFQDFPDTRCIDVRDVAEAHILAAVYPEAKVGRGVPRNNADPLYKASAHTDLHRLSHMKAY